MDIHQSEGQAFLTDVVKAKTGLSEENDPERLCVSQT